MTTVNSRNHAGISLGACIVNKESNKPSDFLMEPVRRRRKHETYSLDDTRRLTTVCISRLRFK